MQVRVADLPDGGKSVALKQDETWVKNAVESALERAVEQFEGHVLIEGEDHGRVETTFDLDLTWSTPCDRCTKSIAVSLTSQQILRFQPSDPRKGSSSDDEEVELGEDELDVGWYTDGTLSIADALSEAVALALPMRSACEDVAECDARTARLLDRTTEPPSGHPGFAALKNWT